jgi:hypothetical protein
MILIQLLVFGSPRLALAPLLGHLITFRANRL